MIWLHAFGQDPAFPQATRVGFEPNLTGVKDQRPHQKSNEPTQSYGEHQGTKKPGVTCGSNTGLPTFFVSRGPRGPIRRYLRPE